MCLSTYRPKIWPDSDSHCVPFGQGLLTKRASRGRASQRSGIFISRYFAGKMADQPYNYINMNELYDDVAAPNGFPLNVPSEQTDAEEGEEEVGQYLQPLSLPSININSQLNDREEADGSEITEQTYGYDDVATPCMRQGTEEDTRLHSQTQSTQASYVQLQYLQSDDTEEGMDGQRRYLPLQQTRGNSSSWGTLERMITIVLIVLLLAAIAIAIFAFYHKGDRRSMSNEWSQWSSWGSCICPETCGTGIKKRFRLCTIFEENSALNCSGPHRQIKNCSTVVPCSHTSIWSQWSSWGTCGPCDAAIGVQQRVRLCIAAKEQDALYCQGPDRETKNCSTFIDCPSAAVCYEPYITLSIT